MGKLRKPTTVEGYRKPATLIAELERLFKIGRDGLNRKLTALDMREFMMNKTKADGSLFYCWANRETFIRVDDKITKCSMCGFNRCVCNGALLKLSTIDEWMGSAAKKLKDAGNKRKSNE